MPRAGRPPRRQVGPNRPEVQTPHRSIPVIFAKEGSEDIHGQWEHDRRVLIGSQLKKRLQIPQLQGGRALREFVGRLPQLAGRLHLAACVDDFRPPLPLRLRLTGHGPLHRLRDLHVLNLHDGHIDTPRVRLHLDDLTEVRVEFLPVGEEGVEIRPA